MWRRVEMNETVIEVIDIIDVIEVINVIDDKTINGNRQLATMD